MKKATLLKTMLLLCALIVGSGSAWAQAAVNTVLWAEDFSGYSNKTVPSGEISNSHTGTTVYGSGNVIYTCEDGGTTTQVYVDTSGPHTDANNANLLISKTNGTFTVSGIPTGSATELTLSYEKSGGGTLSVSTSTTGVSISGSTITTNGASTITLTFENTHSSKNLRVDDISLIVKTAGSSSSKTATTTTIDDSSITNTDLKNGTAAGSLSASVTAGETAVGATVTWSSDDESVATIDEDGVVTLVGVGTATITASYAGDATYEVSSDTYDLTVTDTRTATTTTIVSTGITNTDLNNGTAAGSLSASVTAGDDPVVGATVTWTSSDETVATISSAGVVTLVKVGTTTITASYAGGGSYAASSNTYDLTVVDTSQKNPVTIQMTNSLFGEEVHTSGTADSDLTFVGYQDNVKVTYFVPKGSYYYFNTSNTRPYNTCTLTYGAPSGYAITQIVFTSDGSNWNTATPSNGSMTATKTWEGFASEVTFSWETSGTRIKTVVVTLDDKTTVTIGDSKYASFCIDAPLDFSETSVKAYKAKVEEGKVVLTEVSKVPANEGVILYCATADSYDVPVATSAAAVSDNELVGVTADTEVAYSSSDKYNYILQSGTFKKANGGTLRANRAYLSTSYDVTSVGAHELQLVFDDGETTGIKTALMNNEVKNNEVYNLNGQRVNANHKGIVIVNGKKYFNK